MIVHVTGHVIQQLEIVLYVFQVLGLKKQPLFPVEYVEIFYILTKIINVLNVMIYVFHVIIQMVNAQLVFQDLNLTKKKKNVKIV